LLTLVVDQVSKFFVVRYLGPNPGDRVIHIFGPLRLIYTTNDGVSFGQLQGRATWIFLFNMIIVIGLFAAYRYLLTDVRWVNLALGLILGGALGNQTDRLLNALRYGLENAHVIDFIYLDFWPVFNVADSAITVGGIIYGVYLIFFQKYAGAKEHQEEESCPSTENSEVLKTLESKD
jgi:signal peptidase II